MEKNSLVRKIIQKSIHTVCIHEYSQVLPNIAIDDECDLCYNNDTIDTGNVVCWKVFNTYFLTIVNFQQKNFTSL